MDKRTRKKSTSSNFTRETLFCIGGNLFDFAEVDA